jgi:hypothetical protein
LDLTALPQRNIVPHATRPCLFLFASVALRNLAQGAQSF